MGDDKVTSGVQDDYHGKEGQIAVAIHSGERAQGKIAKLEVNGIAQRNKETVLAGLSSTEGQPFSEYNVAVDRDNILTQYFSQGFPTATFEWSSKPAAEPNRVELTFVISEGKRPVVRQALTSRLATTHDRIGNRTS